MREGAKERSSACKSGEGRATTISRLVSTSFLGFTASLPIQPLNQLLQLFRDLLQTQLL